MQSPQLSGSIDVHAHIVTSDLLALLQRDGQHYATRIVERDGQRLFLIGETATRRSWMANPAPRPIKAKARGLEEGAARLQDMDAEGIGCEAISCVPFVMYPGVEADRGLAVAQVHNDSVAAFAARRPERFVGL